MAALREAESQIGQARQAASEARYNLKALQESRSWKLTWPLRLAKTAYLEAKHWLRPARLYVPSLTPVWDVVVERDGYRSTGSDPSLVLDFAGRRHPWGLCEITIKVTADGPRIAPKLYVDHGAGFSEHTAIALPSMCSLDRSCYVHLPARFRALRLDPLDEPGSFRIEKFDIVQLGLLGVGLRRLLRVLRDAEEIGALNGVLRLLRVLHACGFAGVRACLLQRPQKDDYEVWRVLAANDAGVSRATRQRQIAEMPRRPLISIIMPTYNTPRPWLRKAIESVRKQIYPRWELCIADDASTDPEVREILKRYAREDRRIKLVLRKENGHIAAASNSAVEVATGEFLALLDHDDELSEDALFHVAQEINKHPDVELVYSDEDKINHDGKRFAPYFKCDWNYDLFLGHNLVSHLGVYRTERVRRLGGFRTGFDGSQDYDLALRFIEGLDPSRIRHIPRVLYHWRAHRHSTASRTDAKPYAFEASTRAIQDHLMRIGSSADVSKACGTEGMHRIAYRLPIPEPRVSIIVLSRNRIELLRSCVSGVLDNTAYTSVELIIVDNGTDEADALSYLARLAAQSRVRVIRDCSPFNFSALNNRAVAEAKGEFVCLLNNDVEIIGPGWLAEMVAHAARPGVGAVGARLWYPNDTLQHGGIVLGQGGVATHAHYRLARGDPGYVGKGVLTQAFSAVTGACLVVRRSTYLELEGLDERLPVAFNDVDFCLRLIQAGYRNVWTPYAELYHHESASRGCDAEGENRKRLAGEEAVMRERWKSQIDRDPFTNPNLRYDHPKPTLRWPSGDSARPVDLASAAPAAAPH